MWTLLVTLVAFAFGNADTSRVVLRRDTASQKPATRVQLTEEPRVVVGRDGAVWVVSPRTCQLKVVAADGTSVNTLGSCGDGPLQFRDMTWIGTKEDTIWVWDQVIGRLTLIPAVNEGRSAMRRLDFSRTRFRGQDIPVVVGLLPNGGYLLHQRNRLGAPELVGHEAYIRLNSKGSSKADTLLVDVVAPARTVLLEGSGKRGIEMHLAPLFASTPLVEVLRDGAGMIVIQRAPGEASQPSIRIMRFDSHLRAVDSIAVPFVPVPLSAVAATSARKAAIERIRAQQGGLSKLDERKIAAALSTPPYLPPVDRAIADGSHAVWLRMTPLGDAKEANWRIVDLRTGACRSASLPVKTEVVGVSGRTVWTYEPVPARQFLLVRYRVE